MKTIATLLLLTLVSTAHAAQTIVAQVNGMVCAFCAQGIEKKARALPQAQEVYVNLQEKIVAVQLKDGTSISPETISGLVKEAGYEVRHIETVDENAAAIRARLEKKPNGA